MQGIGHTRNKGIEEATGYYLYFIDSDDWLDASTIEKCVAHMNEDIDFVSHGVQNVAESEADKEEAVIRQKWFEGYSKPNGVYSMKNNIKRDVCPVTWNKLYRLGIVRKFDLRFVNLTNEDEAFLWTYGIHAKRYYHIHELLYFYWRHQDSCMGQRDKTDGILDIIKIHEAIFKEISRFKQQKAYRLALTRNFKSDMRYLYLRLPEDKKAAALSLIKHYVFHVREWYAFALKAFYFKLYFKGKP